jgi:sugar lactone lactonase YvrE
MFRRIQSLKRGQRLVVYILLFGGLALLLAAISLTVILLIINSGERPQGKGVAAGVTVREFAVLPDDDAYPASIAAAPDGTVYSGSYVSGVLWRIAPDGSVSDLPGTRGILGAVSGLTLGPDGALYVVYLRDSGLAMAGGGVARVAPDGTITDFPAPDGGFLLPDDIALDAQGRVYVSDRGRRAVLRFAPDGSGGAVWWAPPSPADTPAAPTGLAYDAATDTLIVTDSSLDEVYRLSLDGQVIETLYAQAGRPNAPGLDGVTAAPDGAIYAAALAQNRVVQVVDGELVTLAEGFRGVSDVDYHAGRLYATNFDSFSLVVPAVQARLPFALDVIELSQ